MNRSKKYTDEEIHAAKRLRDSGLSWKKIASIYGGDPRSWMQAVHRYDARGRSDKEPNEHKAYLLGRSIRKHGMKKSPPYPYMTNLWSFWLAGWNDMDIELSHETQTNGAETQPAPGTDPLAA